MKTNWDSFLEWHFSVGVYVRNPPSPHVKIDLYERLLTGDFPMFKQLLLILVIAVLVIVPTSLAWAADGNVDAQIVYVDSTFDIDGVQLIQVSQLNGGEIAAENDTPIVLLDEQSNETLFIMVLAILLAVILILVYFARDQIQQAHQSLPPEAANILLGAARVALDAAQEFAVKTPSTADDAILKEIREQLAKLVPADPPVPFSEAKKPPLYNKRECANHTISFGISRRLGATWVPSLFGSACAAVAD